MSEFNSFDRLVSEISSDERSVLLKKLRESVDPESQTLELPKTAPAGKEQPASDLDSWLKEESVLLRIWLYIKALFSNSAVGDIYNSYILSREAKNLNRMYPGLVDYGTRTLLAGFYEKLEELKHACDFFSPVVTGLDNDAGSFYVFLGSLAIPDLSNRISQEADPMGLPLERDITSELRASMLRKLDDIVQNLSSVQRNNLYQAVKGAEWIHQFTHLPFERFLASFSSSFDPTYTCPLDSVSTELSSFARLLCNGPRIMPELLEAFYLFAEGNCLFDNDDSKPSAEEYMQKAASQISLIKMFITTVPLQSICKFAFHSAVWMPGQPNGVEDWFVKYKTRWKKWFDTRWSQWLESRKKEAVRVRMDDVFHVAQFPLYPQRPWASIWGGLTFKNEYALGFLHYFLKNVYMSYAPVLKTLLLEGDFYQKENRLEFADTCNDLVKQISAIDMLTEKLLPEGEYGSVMEHYGGEKMHSIQIQAKINVLLDTIQTETSVMIARFCDSARSILLILGGILSDKRDSHYDSLSNISSIQGKDNQAYRKKLESVRKGFEAGLEIIKDLEPITAPPGMQ